jgi:hypothetical protein
VIADGTEREACSFLIGSFERSSHNEACRYNNSDFDPVQRPCPSSGRRRRRGWGWRRYRRRSRRCRGRVRSFDRIGYSEPNQSQRSRCSPDKRDRRTGPRRKPQQLAGSAQSKQSPRHDQAWGEQSSGFEALASGASILNSNERPLYPERPLWFKRSVLHALDRPSFDDVGHHVEAERTAETQAGKGVGETGSATTISFRSRHTFASWLASSSWIPRASFRPACAPP